MSTQPTDTESFRTVDCPLWSTRRALAGPDLHWFVYWRSLGQLAGDFTESRGGRGGREEVGEKKVVGPRPR